MRITRYAVAALAAAGALAVAVPADAATGTLTINNDSYTDPSGKYWGFSGSHQPGSRVYIANNTDEPATVNRFQTGGEEMYLGTVQPGESRSFASYTVVVHIQ